MSGEAALKTDDVLVAEARDGGVQAFDQLMLRYEKLVCKVAMNYVKDKQNALDVTQNVFLKVYKNLDSVTAEGMFKPWLLRITYNESINWIRRGKRHAGHDELEHAEASVASTADQESTLVLQERQRQLIGGMKQLNPKYRRARALRYAEGMRIREIADVMECSEGMVKSLLFRGVRQIKDRVAKSA
jgi:RNA polymerase sigma-70 factor (ECF subfamily)